MHPVIRRSGPNVRHIHLTVGHGISNINVPTSPIANLRRNSIIATVRRVNTNRPKGTTASGNSIRN